MGNPLRGSIFSPISSQTVSSLHLYVIGQMCRVSKLIELPGPEDQVVPSPMAKSSSYGVGSFPFSPSGRSYQKSTCWAEEEARRQRHS